MKRITISGLIIIFSGLFTPTAYSQAQYAVAANAATIGQLPQKSYDSLRNILKMMNAGLLNDTVILKFEYDVVPAGNQLPKENAEIIQQKITEELRMLHGVQTVRKKISVVNLAFPASENEIVAGDNNMQIIATNTNVQTLLSAAGIDGNSVMLLPKGQFISMKTTNGWAALQLNPAEIGDILNNRGAGFARK